MSVYSFGILLGAAGVVSPTVQADVSGRSNEVLMATRRILSFATSSEASSAGSFSERE